jgi:diacylglycerol kinase (ATP)
VSDPRSLRFASDNHDGSMKKIFLIINPAAARAGERSSRAIAEVLEGAGCHLTVLTTSGPGDAVELCREAVREKADVVAVFGGDGTVMEALEGLVGAEVPLGVIPGGTANLLAGNLRIPNNPAKAAQVVGKGRPRTIDIGRLETEEVTKYFAVGAGAGYDAELMLGTSGDAKRRWGVGAYVSYVMRTAPNIRPIPFRVTIDGSCSELDAASVLVANCREIMPGILSLGHEVALDDGHFDTFILKAHGLLESASLVMQLMRRKVKQTEQVRRMRGREVHVECDTPQPVECDGDVVGTTPFTATIIPGGRTVMVPR